MEINLTFAMLLTTLAGLATGIGSAIAFFIRTPRYSYLSLMLGFSAGVMIYISFAELLKTAINDVGFGIANIAFFAGIAFIAVIDIAVPHSYEAEQVSDTHPGFLKRFFGKGKGDSIGRDAPVNHDNAILMRAGLFTAIGIAIHNFPEGMVTFSCAATGDLALGMVTAVAIAIHNIPEGIAVSVPIFYATGSRRKAFLYSFSSGLAEPVGALIGYAILMPFLTPALLACLLAFVAGIMVFISLDELLPLAHRYGQSHLAIIGVVIGMAVMAGSLYLLG